MNAKSHKSAPGRSPGRTKNKHRSILDAAVKVFARKGFFQAKVTEIAWEAGVANGTVYLYFKSKDDLLISIFEEKMNDVLLRFRAAVGREKGALARLKCLVRMHLGEFQADPDLAAVFQVELRQSSRFMREYKNAPLREYLDLIGQIVNEGRREGLFRRDIPLRLIKRFIFGALDEMVSTWVLAGSDYDIVAQGDPLVDLFVNGIGRSSLSTEAGALAKNE